MSPTTEDLRLALEQAAEPVPAAPGIAERAARSGRILRRRRTGVVIAAVAVTIAALAIPNIGIPGQSSTDVTSTVFDDLPDFLPEYRDGYRLIASTRAQDPSGASVTFTVGDRALAVFSRCSSPEGDGGSLLLLDGVEIGRDFRTCNTPAEDEMGTGVTSFGPDLTSSFRWSDTLTPGTSVTVRQEWSDQGSRPGSRWWLGVYEAVPFSEYVFPDPPKTLAPLPAPLQGHGRRLVWGDGFTDPIGFIYTVRVDEGLDLLTQTVEPGELRLYVNDKLMATAQSWSYSEEDTYTHVTLRQLGVEPGTKVDIRFEADRFTGNTYRLAVYDNISGNTKR